MNLTCTEIESLIKACAVNGVSEFEFGELKVSFDPKKRLKQALAPTQVAQNQLIDELIEQQETADEWFSATPPPSTEI